MKNILINKKFIFSLQFIVAIITFIFAYTKCIECSHNQSTGKISYMMDFLKLPRLLCILRIRTHNYLLSLLQAIFSFFSFGILGICFLFSTFYTYGFVFKYTKDLFLFLEMVGTIISIFFNLTIF